MQLMGLTLWCVPESRVYHLGGGSLPADNPRKTYLNFRNNLLLLHKNLPVADRRGALLRRRLLDTVAWAKFVVTLDFPNAGAILRAHRDFRRMLVHYSDRGNLSLPQVNLLRDPRRPNILLSYYLLGRRRYSSL